jgi:hypothetical protein
MTETLAEKTCTPCRGGVPPLARDEALRFQAQAPDWELRDDAHRIVRALDPFQRLPPLLAHVSIPQFPESTRLRAASRFELGREKSWLFPTQMRRESLNFLRRMRV